jgi:uncharacterized protein YhaN
MAKRQVKTSQRFTRAARAERERLDRQRVQVSKRREVAQAKVDALDEELEAIDEQRKVLEDLAESRGSATEIREIEPQVEGGGRELLRGAQIRAVAVPLLLREHGIGPIHYKDWYALVRRAGYAVAGKRPDAVFLNQVSRSPLVWTSTQSGSYYLDTSVIASLREELGQQQRELAGLLRDVPADSRSLEAHRERQRDVGIAINRIDRELDEAIQAIETAEAELPEMRVIRSTDSEAA